MIDVVKKAADVRIEHPVHLAMRDPHIECVQGVVLASARPKPVAEAKEVLFIYLLEDHHQRFLDDLVLKGGDADGALLAIGLGNPDPLARLGPVASTLNTIVQVDEALFEPLAVLCPCHVVDSDGGIALERAVGLPKQSKIDMMQQVGELLLGIPSGCLSSLPRTLDALFGPCVPTAVACSEFPSATGLLSTDSAGDWPSNCG